MKTLATLCLVLFAGMTAVAGEALTTVAAARKVLLKDIKAPIAFDFTGMVMSKGDIWRKDEIWTFADDTGGAHIFVGTIHPAEARQWDVVRVKGEMIVAGEDKTRRFVSHEVEILRHGAPVPPVDATATEISAGKHNYRFVRIRGVLTSFVVDEVSPDFFWAVLRTETGKVFLCIGETEMRKLPSASMADAEVEAIGLAHPISGLRRGLGNFLRVFAAEDVKVLKPPPEDPFSTAQTLSDTDNSPHRQRTTGDVIAVSRKHFFLQTDIGRTIMAAPVSGTPMPQPGERVEAVGFPEHAPYWLVLADATVRTVGKALHTLDMPKKATISELFTDSKGRKRFTTNLNGHRIAFKGKVKAATEDELELSDGENSIFVMIGSIRSQLKEVPDVGSTIEATGLCWTEFHNKYESDIYPVFLRFTLYPHDAADIRVIASPPWWTAFRLLMLVLVLAALLAGSFVWSIALNRKAERRGRELYEERASHAIAEKKVEERTRLAVELHDSLSQTLTGIAMQLDVGNADTAKRMLTACRSDLRRCLWDLRSRTFEEKDMTEAIERTLKPHSVGAKIAVRFNVPRERLSDSTTHTTLRIIRELVVNAIRHGKATAVKVAGECHGDTISFSVRDNGCGFDPETAPGPREGHFGLLGIRERIKAFGGEMSIKSESGQGTHISIRLAIA